MFSQKRAGELSRKLTQKTERKARTSEEEDRRMKLTKLMLPIVLFICLVTATGAAKYNSSVIGNGMEWIGLRTPGASPFNGTECSNCTDVWVDESGDTMTGNLTVNATLLIPPTHRICFSAGAISPCATMMGSTLGGFIFINNTAIDSYIDFNVGNLGTDISKSGELTVVSNRVLIRQALNVTNNITTGKYIGDGSLLTGIAGGGSDVYVNETGDTMSGNLIINANLTVDNNILIVDSSNDCVGINTTTPTHTLEVTGDLKLAYTATSNDEHGLEILVDAAGFGDVKGLNMNYITGAIATNEEEEVILINIDQFSSTGGMVTGLEVLTTEGSAEIHALEVGAQADPILHLSGDFGNMDSANSSGTNVLSNFTTTVNDSHIYINDDDYIIIGSASKFQEIEFILDTGASISIKPTFEFSTGVGAWNTFSPADGTNGMENTGVILWGASDILTWAVGANAEYLIRITRTRNNLVTTPIENLVQISAVTEYGWDKDANVTIQRLNVSGNINISGEFDQAGENIYIGSDDTSDKFICFYEDGKPCGEFFKWDDGADHFRLEDSFQVWSGGVLFGVTLSVSNVAAFGSDIYTTGAGDNLYLGNPTEANADFNAHANGDLFMQGDLGIGNKAPAYPVDVNDSTNGISVYTSANVSAEGFIDRTVFPDEHYNALDAIQNIRSDSKGKLDHESLPEYASASVPTPVRRTRTINNTDCTKEVKEELGCVEIMNQTYISSYKIVPGRNLGNMVSINTKAIQELLTKIETLESELCKYDARYKFCT